MSQNSIILGKNGDQFQYINCDAEGKLNVNLDSETIDVHVNFPLIQDVKVVDKIDISGYTFNENKLKVDISGQRVNIAGQTITVASLNTVAQQVTLSNINQNLPQLTTDAQDRLYISTEGQSINIGNTVSVNGTVNVGSGNISVSNFPAQQEVIGSVNVSNMISGFALDSTLSGVKTSIDNKHLSSASDSVTVTGSVSVSNLPATQTIQGTVAVSNTGFQVSNFPATQPISGNVSVSNFPDTQPVSGSVSISSLPSIGITNTSFEVSNFPATQPVSGNVTVNTITGFALDSTTQNINTNLTTLNTTLTNKTLSKNTSSIDISGQRIDISGQMIDISGQKVDISGQMVDISGQRVDISGQNIIIPHLNKALDSIDISGQWVNSKIYGSSDGVDYHHIKTNTNGVVSTNAVIQDTNGDNFTSHLENGFRGLDTYVLNKIDISGNSYNQDKLKVDVSGQYVNISNNVKVVNGDTNFQTNTYLVNDDGYVADVVKNDLFTLGMLCVLPCSNAGLPYSEFNPMYTMMKAKEPGGANVNLTLTEIDTYVKALDVNVANTSTIGVKTIDNTLKVDISGVELFEDKLKVDVSGQRIDISGQTVILGGFDGGVNSNITNSILKVDISGVEIFEDKLKVDISGQNTIMNAYYRTGGNYSSLTSVQPYGTTNVKALETYSYTVGLNNVLNVPLPITSTTGEISQSLDVHIQNGSTTNLQGQNGINIYPVFPKMKQYTIGGIESNSNAYKMIGGNPTASGLDISGFAYGLANARPYYASTTTGTPTTDLYIDYVNSSGDLIENAGPYSVVAGSWTTLPTMVGINKFRLSSTLGNTLASQSLYISPITNTNRSLYHLSLANYGIGVFTIPNGYIGYISSLTCSFDTGAALLILKWDENGIRSVVYKMTLYASVNYTLTSGPEGSIGGIFYPGESIGFTNNVAVLSKLVQANITLRAII